MRENRVGRLGSLDGWRAVSVALVVIGHIFAFSTVSNDLLAGAASRFSLLGVYVFFCISGFVIVRGLLAEERISIGGFYIRRAFRILPPLAIYLVGVIGLVWLQVIDAEAVGSLKALLFICNFDKHCGGWFGAHTWSLSVEEQFYLVAPLALSLILPARRPILALALILPAVVAGLYVLKFTYPASQLFPFQAIAWGALAAAYERRLAAFAVSLPGVVVALGVVFIVLAWGLPNTAVTTVLRIVSLPVVVALLLRTAFLEERWSGFLRTPGLRAVGVASYSIYLWQQIATFAYPGADAAFYAMSVSACVVFALLLYRFIELPLIIASRNLAPLSPPRPGHITKQPVP